MPRFSEPRVSPVKFAVRDDNGALVRDAAGRVKTIEQFTVTIAYLPGSDELWETLVHPAHFRDAGRAQRLVDRIKRSRAALKLENWTFGGHVCSPLGAFGPAKYSVL